MAAACNYTLNGNRRSNAGAYLAYVKQLKAAVKPKRFTKTYDEVKAQSDALDIKTEEPFLTRLRVGELLLFVSQVKILVFNIHSAQISAQGRSIRAEDAAVIVLRTTGS